MHGSGRSAEHAVRQSGTVFHTADGFLDDQSKPDYIPPGQGVPIASRSLLITMRGYTIRQESGLAD